MANKERRTPRQDRAQATVDAVVEAAARILVEDGWDRLSTNRVAARAGVSIGTLYQYFSNREAIVEALVHRIAEERIQAFGSRLMLLVGTTDLPLEEGLRALLQATVEAMRVRPELSRRLLQEVPRGGLMDLERAWITRCTAFVRTAMYRRRESIRDGNPEIMAAVLVRACFAVLQDAQAHRPELVDGPELVEELAVLAVGYLRRPSSGP